MSNLVQCSKCGSFRKPSELQKIATPGNISIPGAYCETCLPIAQASWDEGEAAKSEAARCKPEALRRDLDALVNRVKALETELAELKIPSVGKRR
jgi:hypothetical protein